MRMLTTCGLSPVDFATRRFIIPVFFKALSTVHRSLDVHACSYPSVGLHTIRIICICSLSLYLKKTNNIQGGATRADSVAVKNVASSLVVQRSISPMVEGCESDLLSVATEKDTSRTVQLTKSKGEKLAEIDEAHHETSPIQSDGRVCSTEDKAPSLITPPNQLVDIFIKHHTAANFQPAYDDGKQEFTGDACTEVFVLAPEECVGQLLGKGANRLLRLETTTGAIIDLPNSSQRPSRGVIELRVTGTEPTLNTVIQELEASVEGFKLLVSKTATTQQWAAMHGNCQHMRGHKDSIGLPPSVLQAMLSTAPSMSPLPLSSSTTVSWAHPPPMNSLPLHSIAMPLVESGSDLWEQEPRHRFLQSCNDALSWPQTSVSANVPTVIHLCVYTGEIPQRVEVHQRRLWVTPMAMSAGYSPFHPASFFQSVVPDACFT
jgi:hypothetical protein